MQKGKVRNPWIVLLLTVVTFGLYLIYWVIINPIEIKKAFHVEKIQRRIKLIFVFMIWGAGLILVYTIFVLIQTVNSNFENIFLYSTIITLVMVFIGAFFFYFLCSAAAMAQKEAKIEPFEIITVFGVYLVNLLIEAGSDLKILSSKFFKGLPNNIENPQSFDTNSLNDLMPILNMAGLVNLLSTLLFVFFIFLLQKQFNRLWEEGIFPDSVS
ncbi:hypothetical protein ACFLR4_00245 [Bacteroidota bacterium]